MFLSKKINKTNTQTTQINEDMSENKKALKTEIFIIPNPAIKIIFIPGINLFKIKIK
jgi:hypothetical protein